MKDSFIGKLANYFVISMVLLLFVTTPDMIKKLNGQVVSIGSSKEVYNTGVVLTGNYFQDKNNASFEVYNGSNNAITITGYASCTIDDKDLYEDVARCDSNASEINGVMVESNDNKTISFNLDNNVNLIGIDYILNNKSYRISHLINDNDVLSFNNREDADQNLKTALLSFKDEMLKTSSDKVAPTTLGDMYKKYLSAKKIYENSSASLENIEVATSNLNDYEINYIKVADYSKLNELLVRINYNTLNSEWYTTSTWDSFNKEYNKLSSINDLTYIYQNKIDFYTNKLSNLYDTLVIKDADYEEVNKLKEQALGITNETNGNIQGAKYKLYSDSAWEDLQAAINNVEDGKTIKDQGLVDSWASDLKRAIDNLENNKRSADYTELNNLIKKYTDSEEKKNNWYVSTTEVDNYISNINTNLTIENQYMISGANGYIDNLSTKISNLEIKAALGYNVSDNYKYGSIEEVVGLLKTEVEKECYERLYTDKTKKKISHYLKQFSNSSNDVMNIKINNQAKLDRVLIETNSFINELNSLKRGADYSGVFEIVRDLIHLDSNLYANYEIVDNAFDSINMDYKLDEQNKVNIEQNKLIAIFNQLEFKKADTTNADKALGKAYEIINNANNYSNVEDVIRYTNKINALMSSDNFDIIKQEALDDLTKKLNKSIEAAKLKSADYSKLNLLKSKLKDVNININYDLTMNDNEVVEEYYSNLIKASNNAFVISDELPINVLSYVKVNGELIDLNSMRTDVDYSVENVNIMIGLKDKDSDFSISNIKSLNVGDNVVVISVIASDNTIHNYNLVITRKNTSSYLRYLKVKDSNMHFNKNENEYVVNVDDKTNSLDITTVSEDEDAIITVIGNNNLKDGSKVLVKVEDKNGGIRVYTLSIKKNVSVSIWVIIGLSVALMFILSLLKYISLKRRLKVLIR